MPYSICPECAFATDDPMKDQCDYCRTKLLRLCPVCGKEIQHEKTIYCAECGQKLKISYIPLQ